MISKKLDGRKEAEKILAVLKKKVAARRRPLTLATIIVGLRPDSQLYIKLKTAAARRVGIRTQAFTLPPTVSQQRLERLIVNLNQDKKIHGILLQLPLPPKLNADKAVAAIAAKKDVDGFHKHSRVLPPTIAAVLHLLNIAKPRPRAACVILAKRGPFSERLAAELRQRKYRVAIVSTGILPKTLRACDVIISARGRGPFLAAKNISKKTIVIDVGIRRVQGKTVGDVARDAWSKARAISPVPGGVGPLTVAYVLKNLYTLAAEPHTPRP